MIGFKDFKKMKLLNKIISLTLLTPTLLFSDVNINIGDIEKEIPKLKFEKKKLMLPEFKETKDTKSSVKENEKTIFIKSLTFTGNSYFNDESLLYYSRNYINKYLTFNQIMELTSVITKEYRKKGYFVANAYIPKQSIKDGNLKIAIIEGKYGNFDIDNNSLVNKNLIKNLFNKIKKYDDVISIKNLQRAMLLVNDTPGVVITKARMKAGEKVGTSDFSFITRKTNRYDGYYLIDNAGSRYTGEYRLILGLDINSPFKIGDKFSLSGLVSNETNLTNARLAYNLPLNSDGLRSEISYSQTNYSLAKEYKDLQAKGSAKTLGISLRYPIIRSQLEDLYIKTGFSKKQLKDQQLNSINNTKKATIFNLGLQYNKSILYNDIYTLSNINFDFTSGDLDGSYNKINLDIEEDIQFNNKLSLESSLSIQYALGNKNLDGSEDFSIGGQNGVKLYPSSELSAENGYLFNIEAKYKLPSIYLLNPSVGFFYDIGRVYMIEKTSDFQARTLQDAGIGIYTYYKDFFGQIQIAWSIDDEEITTEAHKNSRILFQSGMIF